MSADLDELFEVHILRFPLPLFERSRRHMEALTREFEFIAEGDTAGTPARLIALVERVGTRFAGLNDAAEARVEEALLRGDDHVDVVYRVPRAASDACVELNAMLDEADDFCRHGELLTLATPGDQVAFRRWFLDEFVTQLAGGAPTAWPGERADRAGSSPNRPGPS
jgi:hypothetical protein